MADDGFSLSMGEFVREGTMLALPLCFPGQSSPPPAGETAAQAMCLGANGTLYIGTHGERAHVMAAVLQQDAGIVVDRGTVPAATGVACLCVRGDTLFILASGPGGSVLLRTRAFTGSFYIQEWGIQRSPLEEVAAFPFSVEPGAVASADGASLFGVVKGSGEIVRMCTESGKIEGRWDTKGGGRYGAALCLDRQGGLWGTAGKAAVWTIDTCTGGLEWLPRTAPCAAGREQHTQASSWAVDPVTGMLFGGTLPDGFLFSLDPATRQMRSLGKPVRQGVISCMAVGNDGRLFGIAGDADDICHLFVHDPRRGTLDDLGIPVSTLTLREYGYHFGCARVGRDGEIYFGQDERVNHLWVYYPRVPERSGG
jgi:hypothetical protein